MSKQTISLIPGFAIGQPGQTLPPMAPGITRLQTTICALGEPVFTFWFTVGTEFFRKLDEDGRADLIEAVQSAAIGNCIQCDTVEADRVLEEQFADAA